ncbi:MAG: L,D-transpeptidase [Candidatus Blackburnbacteria bacterium]|nr:L,D-transpeptidase [Candidatus Blackburnbacteria bacterium]
MASEKGFAHIFVLLGIIGILVLAFLWQTNKIKKEARCANSISCAESLKLKVENDAVGIFNKQKITPPKIDLSQKEPATQVLGDSASAGEKRVEVDLTTQTLTAYEGDKVFMQTLISSGKWFPTPPGAYVVWVKLKASRMTGGEGSDY